MRRPWVKLPVDFTTWDPALAGAPPEIRGTFIALFCLAQRNPGSLGFLTDERGEQLSLREMARTIYTPHPTLHRHLRQLEEAQLILPTQLERKLLVPLVVKVEQRFGTITDGPHTTTEWPRRGRQPRRRAVENLELPLTTGPPGVRSMDHFGPPTDHTKKDLQTERSFAVAKDVTASVDFESEGEEPEPVASAMVGDLMLRVPSDVTSPTIRHLIAKLASLAYPWARLLEDPRDRALLNRLYREHRAGLQSALEQASYDPQAVHNAGAWLSRTVPEIDKMAAAS